MDNKHQLDLLYLVLVIIYIIGAWKVFVKAGKPGWTVLIPFYNTYVLLKIVNRPTWWLILFLIPLVNAVTMLVVAVALAKTFSRGQVFGVFLLGFLPMVGYPILGFGKSIYIAPTAGTTPTTAAPPPPPIPPTQT